MCCVVKVIMSVVKALAPISAIDCVNLQSQPLLSVSDGGYSKSAS